MIAAAPPPAKPNNPNPAGPGQRPDAGMMSRIGTTLKQIIETVFTSGISKVLTFDLNDKDAIVGKFHQEHQLYDYTIQNGGIQYNESEAASGTRSDSFLMGFYADTGRLRNNDDSLRLDRGLLKAFNCGQR
jgi:hypothetical protein